MHISSNIGIEIQVRKRFPPYVLDHFTNLTKPLFSIETNRLVDTIWDYNVIHCTCVIFSSHNVIEAQHITS